MVKVKNLTKVYKKNLALDQVSFSVKKGEITGFLGVNGAGKSTTMNILSGYICPTEGEVLINNFNILEESEQAQKCIGYLPEHPPLYDDMLVDEYLDFVARLKGIDQEQANRQREQLYISLHLSDVRFRLIRNLSKGYKQRIGLAQALVGQPPLLILDEPTSGLDPRQILEFRSLLMDLKHKHTIIISSHILSEIQSVCDRLLVIHEGKIVANDTPLNLVHTLQAENQLSLRVRADQAAAHKILHKIQHIQRIQACACDEPGACEFILYSDVDIREAIFHALSHAQMPILSMMRSHISLEDVFLQLTQK